MMEKRTMKLIGLLLWCTAYTGFGFAQTGNDTLQQMKDTTVHLQEVQVSASRPLIKAELDKMIYQVSDDPDSKSMTLLEMLRKVPMVTVEGNDMVKVKGSTDFKVYVNGKPNAMMSNNTAEMMKSMPASTVKKIEVIVNPGAKYDAEGVAGILNIITINSSKLKGYNINLGAGVMNIAQGVNVSGLVKVGKLTLSVADGVSYSNPPKGWQETERIGKTAASAGRVHSVADYKNQAPAHFLDVEGSYEFDKYHLLSITAGMENYTGKSRTDMHTDLYSGTGARKYGFNNEHLVHNRINSFYTGTDYQQIFGEHGGAITFSYRFSAVPSTLTSSSLYHPEETGAHDLEFADLRTTSKLNTDEHTGQIDYTVSIGKYHTLSVGTKYIHRMNKSDNTGLTRKGGTEDAFVEDRQQSLAYRQKTDISAAYLEYAIQQELWSGKAGLRYEHSSQTVTYPMNNVSQHEDFSAKFDNLVPSLSLGYQLSQTKMLSFSYGMRISRPNIWNLNPYVDRTVPTVIKTGNPDLTTATAHSFNLTFNSFARKFGVNMTAGYDFQNNGIIGYSYWGNPVSLFENQAADEDATFISSYGNLLKRQHVYLNLYVRWMLSRTTVLSMNGTGAYTDFRSRRLGQRNHGYSGNMSATLQQNLPWKLKMVTSFSVSSRSLGLQGHTAGSAVYRLMLMRSFLKEDRLTVTVYGNNLFQNHLRVKQVTETDDVVNRFTNVRRDFRSFGVNCSLRIGKMNDRVKHTRKSISNEDVIIEGNPRNAE